MNEWDGVPDNIEYYQGFVYRITNSKTGQYYIGKKNFWFIQKKAPLKGKKNKRHFKKETDWKSYYGSCNNLKIDIEKYGVENFKREIILLSLTKFDLALDELKTQLLYNVLYDSQSYNEIINVRLRKRKNG